MILFFMIVFLYVNAKEKRIFFEPHRQMKKSESRKDID